MSVCVLCSVRIRQYSSVCVCVRCGMCVYSEGLGEWGCLCVCVMWYVCVCVF